MLRHLNRRGPTVDGTIAGNANKVKRSNDPSVLVIYTW
jgi:hypothetical protein